jgi:molecular chaperone DnaK
MGAKVPQDVRTKLEGAVSNLEDRLKGDDKAAIEAALNNLMNAAGELQQAAQAAGAQAGAAAEAGAGEPGGTRKDDVIDAEYEVTEDGKKG